MKLEEATGPVIINVGCGKRARANMVNLDVVATPGYTEPDYYIKGGDDTGLPSECADEVMAIHNFEHYFRWEVDAVLVEWRRLLKPGGQLTLEMPDIIKCCKNMLTGYTHSGKNPDQFSYWGVYGDPTTMDHFMVHKWGWEPRTLTALLKQHGFTGMKEEPTKWHPGGREHRDFRMIARKP